jgi:large subunit ribosomal protein L2
MGKRILVRRRGRGTSTFRASTHKRISPARYNPSSKEEVKTVIKGIIRSISHEPGRGTPLAFVEFPDGQRFYTVVPEGVHQGQEITLGSDAPNDIGNILPLGKIPEGTYICNIERSPNDGGKLVRASGTYATITAHTPQGTMVKLPSGKTAAFNNTCRATIGVISGAGRVDKPFMKAGARFHSARAKGHTWIHVAGVAMLSAYHPHGGGRHKHPGIPTTVARGTPPGRKVGNIAARHAGSRKKIKD